MTTAEGPDRAQRLAAWLDGLGLTDHLAAAGLPGFVRGDDGRARWSDPGTGDPLTEAQLAELDDLLHHEGDDPRHAVPVPLVQLARRARRREELLATPWEDYASLAERRGASLGATRFAVHRAADDRRLLVVPVEERVVVPSFQLDADAQPRADLAPVLEPLLAAGMDPWRVWAWLTEPVALLGGLVPARAVADPDTEDLARHAAVRLAERVRRP